MATLTLSCPDCQREFPLQLPDSAAGNILITCPYCRQQHPGKKYHISADCPRCQASLIIDFPVSDAPVECPICQHSWNLFASEQFSGNASPLNAQGNGQLLHEGQFLDKYHIIRLLGKGGMSEVYLAEHSLLKQPCAIKIILPELFTANTTYARRFLQEAGLAFTLRHPNIVSVLDASIDPQSKILYIVMEYVEGSTLMQELQNGPFSEPQLLQVIREMASALTALEQANIIHRDIKPANIIHDRQGRLRLTDFGIAISENNSVQLTGNTQHPLVSGTPSYCSPEQASGKADIDQRTDIYSLGATLYHLATTKLPFSSNHPTQTLAKVINQTPEPITKLRPDLSRDLIRLINDMMAKKPDDRPQTAKALLERLNAITPSTAPTHAPAVTSPSVSLRSPAPKPQTAAEAADVSHLVDAPQRQLSLSIAAPAVSLRPDTPAKPSAARPTATPQTAPSENAAQKSADTAAKKTPAPAVPRRSRKSQRSLVSRIAYPILYIFLIAVLGGLITAAVIYVPVAINWSKSFWDSSIHLRPVHAPTPPPPAPTPVPSIPADDWNLLPDANELLPDAPAE